MGKSASDKTNVVVDIKKGSESEVQLKGTKFRLRSKYSIMGGKVAQGDFKANYQNNKLTFEAPPYKLEVELHLGRSIKVEASKNGESMWTYETLREDKSNPNAIVWEANSKMTLNPASKLHKFIQDNYPPRRSAQEVEVLRGRSRQRRTGTSPSPGAPQPRRGR